MMMKKLLMIFLLAISSAVVQAQSGTWENGKFISPSELAKRQTWYCKKNFLEKGNSEEFKECQTLYCKKNFLDGGDSLGNVQCLDNLKKHLAALRAAKETKKRRLDAEEYLQQAFRRQEAERIRTRNIKPQLNTVD
jgi:hypothetical protein